MNRHNNKHAGKNQNQTLEKKKPMQTKQSVFNSNIRSTVIAAFGLLSMLLAVSETAYAQGTPVVFQAAGTDAASIQSSVDAFRAAFGGANNGNNPGPLQSGRREINWDGGDPRILDTTAPVTPFNTFLNTRGSQFTTPGVGLSQAPASGGPQGGLVVLFGNPSYGQIFKTFSPSRLFTPVKSNVTEASFFIPGTNGTVPAVVNGFGAVFTDVDQRSTLIDYLDRDGRTIFTSFVPPSPGDGNLSFFGIAFKDASIAHVRIQTGNVVPGANDDERNDIVMMDDFIYGEPHLLGK
jgi:hypothetical protein